MIPRNPKRAVVEVSVKVKHSDGYSENMLIEATERRSGPLEPEPIEEAISDLGRRAVREAAAQAIDLPQAVAERQERLDYERKLREEQTAGPTI